MPTVQIKVGHTFILDDKYSKALGSKFTDESGKRAAFFMGCYGLGVSRILAAAAEVLSTDSELRFPDRIAPFSACVLAPKSGSKEEAAVGDAVADFYDDLNSEVFPGDVLLDDRGTVTVGKKMREARQSGFTFVVLFGKQSVDGRVELYDYGQRREEGQEECRVLSLQEAIDFLTKRSQQML